jgi:mRNA-degrading endonuclease RelE of RelBE toxin-antitoxin system
LRFKKTNAFKRTYKNLDPQVQRRIDEGLRQLAHRPRESGRHKYGNLNCIYSYDIGNQYRILYAIVNNEEQEVVLMNVGTHKVY